MNNTTTSNTLINVNGSVLTTSGNFLVSDGTSQVSWQPTTSNNLTAFCELVLTMMGCDITYDQFCKMSDGERKSLIRDFKIKKVLGDDGVQ